MNSNDEIYKIKYLKYKQKYLDLKIIKVNLKGGAGAGGIDTKFLSGLLKQVDIDPTNRNVKDTIANIASNSEDEVQICIKALTEIEKSIKIIEKPTTTYEDLLKMEYNTNKQFKIIEDNIETIDTLIETDTTLLNKLNNERTYLFKNKLEICISKLSNYKPNIPLNLIPRFNLICSTLGVIREQLRIQEISVPTPDLVTLGVNKILHIENHANSFVLDLDSTMINIKQEIMNTKNFFNKENFNLQLVKLYKLINNMKDNWNKDIKYPKIIITAPSSDLMKNILFFLKNIIFVSENADKINKSDVEELYFFILMYNNFIYLNKIKDNLIKLNNEKINKTKKTRERYLEYSNIIISIKDWLESIILGENLISNFFVFNQYNNELKRDLITAIKLFETSTKDILLEVYFFDRNSNIKSIIEEISIKLNTFLLQLEEVGKDEDKNEGDRNKDEGGGGGESAKKKKKKKKNKLADNIEGDGSEDEDKDEGKDKGGGGGSDKKKKKKKKNKLADNIEGDGSEDEDEDKDEGKDKGGGGGGGESAKNEKNKLADQSTNTDTPPDEKKAPVTTNLKIGGTDNRIKEMKTKIRNNGFSEPDIDAILKIIHIYKIGIDDACAIFKDVKNNRSEIDDEYMNNLKESVSLTRLENIKSYLDEKTAAEKLGVSIDIYLDYKDKAGYLNINVEEYKRILDKAGPLDLSVKNYLKYFKKANQFNISVKEYKRILEDAKKQGITIEKYLENLSAAANPDDSNSDAGVKEDPIRKQLNDFIKSLDTKLEKFGISEYVIDFNYLLSQHVDPNDINIYISENINDIVSFFIQNPNFRYVFNYTPIISNGKIKSEYTKIQCISLFLIGLLNSAFEKYSISETKEVLSNIIKFEIKGGKSLQLLFSKYIDESEDVLVRKEIQKNLNSTSQEPLHKTDDLDVLVISNKQNVKNKLIRNYYSAKLLLLIYNLVKQNDINIMCQLPTIGSSVFKGAYQTKFGFGLVPFIDIDAEESNPEYFKFEKLEEIRVDYKGVSLLFYIPQLNDYIEEKRYYEQLYLPDPNYSYFLQKIRKSLPYAYGLSNYLLNKSSSTERGGGHSASTDKSSSAHTKKGGGHSSSTDKSSSAHTKEGGGHSDKI